MASLSVDKICSFVDRSSEIQRFKGLAAAAIGKLAPMKYEVVSGNSYRRHVDGFSTQHEAST